MKLILYVQSILIFIQPASTHTVSSFYQRYPGVVWDNCMEPVSATRSKFVMMCGASTGCLGINFLDDVNTTRPCQLCLSSDTKSVSQVPPTSLQSMYFWFNTQTYQPASNDDYVVDFPNGLVDDQVIFFRTKLAFDEDMAVYLIEKNPWSTNSRPEVELLIHITFQATSRPNKIVLVNYDASTQGWKGPPVHRAVGNFLEPGKDTYTVVLVNQLSYTVYIDGKLVYDYLRSQRKTLKEIKHAKLRGICPSVQMTYQ